MLEFNDIVLLTLLSCFFSAIFSAIAALVSHYVRNRDVSTLFAKTEALEMSVRGAVGRTSREQNSARVEEALTKVGIAIKGGKTPADAIKEVAMEYPDVALQIGKKIMSGKVI